LEFEFQSHPAELARIPEILDALGRRQPLGPKTRLALDTALTEHLTNIITHGCRDGAPHRIRVRLTLDPPCVKATVIDDGPPFNPLEHPPVDTSLPLDQKPLGGLGIHMIRSSADELTYRRENDRNILVMRKRLA